MNLKNFFAEVKRRNVYKVAVAYAIVSWLLIQAASILFPTFGAPPWVMKTFVVIIVLGFPVALILAWAFELTPEGIKRTEDVVPNESIARKTGRKLAAVIVAVAVLAAALLVFQFTRSNGTKAKPNSLSLASDKSIAVLPFENLSSDKENAFFAQGIQDEIITTLSRISGLRVISRTSTTHYKSVPEKARSEAEQALRLEPNLGEGHLALGLCSYYGDVDYERALHELDLAARALPNDGDVGLYIAAIRRRQGRWTDSIVAYQNAERNDPRNSAMLYDFSQTYFALRDWPAAAQALDRVLALAPDSITVKIQRAYIEFFSKGNTTPIRAALESISANIDPDGIVSFARWDVGLMDRDAGAAVRTVEACRLESINSPSGVPLPKSYLRACADLMRGDMARAQSGFEAARPAFEIMVANSPKDASRRAHLGLLYAFMGRKEDALAEAQRAVELKPISYDAVDGAELQTMLALIYTRIGEPDQAIPLVEHLLTTPAAVNYAYDSITVSDLRTRWEWGPLRNDSRFQKLIAAPEPKTVYK